MSINRRTLIKAPALVGLASRSAIGNSKNSRTSNFVLVHGTWHGGWVWNDVAGILRTHGHRVLTPTCTGCGDREHLSNPEVGLETHITDIENSIHWGEMDRFILVGHSYSGVTITGVADRMREQVERVIFFDALVPREGRMAGVVRDSETGEFPDWWKARQKTFIDGYRMVLWHDYPVDMLVPPTRKKLVARLKRLITTHPARQWTDELVINNGGWKGLPRSFVHCIGQQYLMTSEKMIGPARAPGWDFVELNIPRDGMLTHPKIVANYLISMTD